ncbi:MAG: sigma 54-interacting transcriptional regulator, partial [Ignavibacteria bacterium]
MNKRSFIYFKLSFLLLVILILYVLPGVVGKINNSVENIYSHISGERTPDTNIVIIHISKSDLDRIGPWPIKRSFYALLIRKLTEQKVRKIGLEVFLSSRLVTQSVYDRLLKNEIENSSKVVLSSLAGRIKEVEGNYFIDSLSYPSPKLLNPAFTTGHINYIKKDGIVIPLILNNNSESEKAFSHQLTDKEVIEQSVLINFMSSWKNFKNFSLSEYFELVQTNSPKLALFKNKIVIIGISDVQLAANYVTAFDDNLPGLGLHAFAVDNLLNKRWIKTEYYMISAGLFIFILIAFVNFQNKFKAQPYYVYTSSFGVSIIITFMLYAIFHIKLALAYLFIPLFVLLITDIVFYLLEKNYLIKGILNESEVLKKLLRDKQSELSKLQNELNIVDGSTSGLVEKIKRLESDIEKLRENEEDKSKAEKVTGGDINNFQGIVYRSNSIHKITEIIKKTAPEEATVLVTGESGTGKELVAKALHELSKRKDNEFITVNCTALTESLLESELFGHVKGAFTGASSDKNGKFEAADKGTIFLDEIGDTSENFQVKLLRVLQSGEIEKVGSAKTTKVDVRVIAATNKDLEVAVRNKEFREDLYYRLNVIQLKIPPLRERKEDIDVLASYFLFREDPQFSLSRAVSKALNDYEWRGNIRELESVIKRAVIFARSAGRDLLQLSDLP